MKKRLQMATWTVLALSLLGTALRLWLLSSGYDEKGLLTASHPGVWLCYLLAAGMIGAVVVLLRPVSVKPRYRKNFPASISAAAGCAAAALGLVSFGLGMLALEDRLSKVCGAASFLAAAAMIGAGFFRFKGLRPHFTLRTFVCLFFTLALYCRYRDWSRESQLSVYLWALLAMIAAMLACYYRAALDGGVGSIPPFLGLSMAALFFCCLAAPGSGDALLYLGFAVHFLCELLCIRLPKRTQPKPVQEA